ncbi:MAG: PAC2 family protein [Chloroflexi bacterium]|nr:PAC2 family protein [Chloroflexota bacterium]
MQYVTFHETPELQNTLVIAAFTGWPDAGDVASATVRHLIRKLGARKFAEIDPEPFYDFTQTRPHTVTTQGTQRSLAWPTGEFYVAQATEEGGRDLVLFLAPEPQLLWKTYAATVFAVLERCQMTQLVTLGGTYDSVPHTGAVMVSGSASEPDLVQRLETIGVVASGYEGPTSIHSVFLTTCATRSIPATSLWGHAPHYVQAVPNWKVTHALLQRLARLFLIDVDLEELRAAGATLERRVERALARDPELREYVRELQEQHEVVAALPPEPLTTDDVMRELEEILRPSAVSDEDEEDEDDEYDEYDDEDEDDDEVG